MSGEPVTKPAWNDKNFQARLARKVQLDFKRAP